MADHIKVGGVGLVPATNIDALRRFGRNDPARLKMHLESLAAFLEQQSNHTKRAYAFALKQFFTLHDWVCPEDVNVAHVAAWKKRMKTEEKSDATIQARLAALTSYFNFLMLPHGATTEPLVRANPAMAITRDDVRVTPFGRSHILDWDKFKKILDALTGDDARTARDRAILIFFAYTGRRRSEVASLRIGDLHMEGSERWYKAMVKGHKEQKFELPAIVYDALVTYWKASGRWGKLRPEHGVFSEAKPNIKRRMLGIGKHDPLNDETLRRILVEAAKRAGINNDPDVHPHAIRHMVARDMLRAKVPLQDIQDALGHASPATTQIYTKQIGGQRSAHEDALISVRGQPTKPPPEDHLAPATERQG